MVCLRKTIIVLISLVLLSVTSSSQTQYTCYSSNPPSCTGSCPPGHICISKTYLSHPGLYCDCVSTTSTTTTIPYCNLNPKSQKCEGYCPNKGYCVSYYGKCTCMASTSTTTIKTTTTLKKTTTTLKGTTTTVKRTTTTIGKTTTTLKTTTTTRRTSTTTQAPSITLPTAGDLLTLTTTTLRPDNPTSIDYTKTPAVPFRNRDKVDFNMNIMDLDGIRTIRLIVNGKTVKTCSPGGENVFMCMHKGGPFGSMAMLSIEVVDMLGNTEILDGSLDIQDTPEEEGGCDPGCSCMTAAQANAMWPGNFEQCSPTPCGSIPSGGGEPGGGGGTVVDDGGGSPGPTLPPTPMYCYREGPTCPGGCMCLTGAQAAAGGPGGVSYRPCGCSLTSCGAGRQCYETGCRKVKGDLRPFRDEHVPYVQVIARHTTTGAEVPIPSGPANASPEDPRIVYQGCLGEGDWELTPVYSDLRLCEGCPLSGSWIPPSVTVSITDLCAPDLEEDFMYDRIDYTPPVVNITTDPATLYYFTKANVTLTAADASGIRMMKLYESGTDVECNPVPERFVSDCCFDGDAVESCIYGNTSYVNYSTVVYRVEACDGAGNINSSAISKKVLVNESRHKIGTLCSCREGSSFFVRFKNWDDIAVGDVIPGGLDEIVVAREDEGRIYVYHVNGTIARNFSSVYTKYDRLAVGDVSGDSMEEILVANNEDGGVYIYSESGSLLSSFTVNFARDDGIAVGDIQGGEKDEILVASAGDDRVYVYDGGGALVGDNTLTSAFSGVRYLGDNDRHDGFQTADVLGDEKEEIILILSSDDELTVYNSYMSGLIMLNLERYTGYDGLTVGDVVGDDKEEFLVGVDEDGAVYVYDLTGLLKVNYFPFTKYDGLAAGELFEGGMDEYVVAIDEDDLVYIEYGGDAPVGAGP
jgi:hypothetical protein